MSLFSTIATSYTTIFARTRRFATQMNTDVMMIMKKCSDLFDVTTVPDVADSRRDATNITFVNGKGI